MELVIRVKGITRRWFFNVLAVVVGIVCTVEILFGFFLYRYYTNAAKDTISNRISLFSLLSNTTKTNFPNLAREYAEQFEYKDLMEVQIIDLEGNIIVTTNGFSPENQSMPDYTNALTSTNGKASWVGKSSSGESIMAGSTILPDLGRGSNGAIRWVISMDYINRHVFVLVSFTAVIGLAVILFATFSGLYFIKSIVHPVQEVSNIARKIAMGDFNARIKVRDNDEIGELCDSINYMASELSHAETMKNEFISSVSHELRTPLTAIKGWGETVRMSLETDDELINKGLDVILNESDRLSGLVEELLDFSRMQSGRLSMDMGNFDILTELNEAVYMYEELARTQKIELLFIKKKSLPPVYGDSDRLKQVFINIIDNSLKYTDEGGQVLVQAIEEEGCIRITVSDTGLGIPAKDLDRVKEKFYKSNKTVRGSGIGLAVADEIVKQHKGLLFLESKENVGTTVTIVLPIATSEEEAEISAVEIPPSAVSLPKNIAVGTAENEPVDDSKSIYETSEDDDERTHADE